MHSENKSGYIHIVGDKGSIGKSEIKSIAINALLSENSFLICGLNRNACQEFLYGKKFTEIPLEYTGDDIDNHGMSLFEELVNSLFFQTKAIKQYYKQFRSNEIYFNKIKCSFILIRSKSEDSDSEYIYDVFQGLSIPVESISYNEVSSLNVLQVDAKDPIQLFNMINVARKLQFEKSSTGKELFHTLFIFDIESATYNKNIEDCSIINKVNKLNKIYLLGYNYDFIESNESLSKLIKLEDINNSTISFFKSLTSIIAKTSNFLLEIISLAIFDSSYSSIIYVHCKGLNLFIDKYNMGLGPLQNIISSLWNRLNVDHNFATETTLAPLIQKFHSYYLIIRENFSIKNEENCEKINFQNHNFTANFEDLELVLFNLCGKIIKQEDLLFNIENIGDITKLFESEDSFTYKPPIHFHKINQYLDEWYGNSERDKEPNILNLRENCQKENLYEDNSLFLKFIPIYKNKPVQCDSYGDNIPCMANHYKEIEPDLLNCKIKSQSERLNKSVVGIKNELSRIKREKSSNYNRFNNFEEKCTRSYLSIPNNFKFSKYPETPISKILFAVNTARRRVREYRNKQQVNKRLTSELGQDMIKPFQSNSPKNTFWNKTLSKAPVSSNNNIVNEIETNHYNAYSIQDKIEIYAEFPDSKKDAEVQVDNVSPCSQSEFLNTSCSTSYGSEANKIEIPYKESIEVTENYQKKSHIFNFNSLGTRIGVNNMFNNSICYTPINSFSYNYQRPAIFQNINSSRIYPVQNIEIANFSGRTRNGNSCFYNRVKQH